MYVCVYQGITDRHIEKAVSEGAKHLNDLRSSLQVGTVCGRCKHCAHKCLSESLQTKEANCSPVYAATA